MTEIALICQEEKFIRRIMEVHAEGIIEIQFDKAECIVAAGRLADGIRKITSMKRMPVHRRRVDHFTIPVQYLVENPAHLPRQLEVY